MIRVLTDNLSNSKEIRVRCERPCPFEQICARAYSDIPPGRILIARFNETGQNRDTEWNADNYIHGKDRGVLAYEKAVAPRNRSIPKRLARTHRQHRRHHQHHVVAACSSVFTLTGIVCLCSSINLECRTTIVDRERCLPHGVVVSPRSRILRTRVPKRLFVWRIR